MAVLTGNEILSRLKTGSIIINPFNPRHLNPNSVNLTLSRTLRCYTHATHTTAYDCDGNLLSPALDMKKNNPSFEFQIPEQGYVLLPGRLYLASTNEYTETHDLVPILEGRSSVGRLGLHVHISAGWGETGFKGTWTLELEVVHPLRVYAGVAIAQIAYHTIEGDPSAYVGKYQDQRGPRPSALWKEFESPAPSVEHCAELP